MPFSRTLSSFHRCYPTIHIHRTRVPINVVLFYELAPHLDPSPNTRPSSPPMTASRLLAWSPPPVLVRHLSSSPSPWVLMPLDVPHSSAQTPRLPQGEATRLMTSPSDSSGCRSPLATPSPPPQNAPGTSPESSSSHSLSILSWMAYLVT